MEDIVQKQIMFVKLFESEAFKLFEQKILELQESAQGKVSVATSSSLCESSYNQLNFLIAERNAYDKVLAVKKEICEDLELEVLDKGE